MQKNSPSQALNAQVSADAGIYSRTVDLVVDLAKNPIIELIVGFALVEKLQDQGVLGSAQGNLVEGLIAGIITAQQIAPLVPALVEGGKGITGALGAIGGLATAIPGVPPPP